jgi:hypothetical protein
VDGYTELTPAERAELTRQAIRKGESRLHALELDLRACDRLAGELRGPDRDRVAAQAEPLRRERRELLVVVAEFRAALAELETEAGYPLAGNAVPDGRPAPAGTG